MRRKNVTMAVQQPVLLTGGERVMRREAVIEGPYRYHLTRIWDEEHPSLLWILLNPSTADEQTDDPTLHRCMGFTQAWGFGSLELVNLFAWRSPHVAALRQAPDPIGPRNDVFLQEACARVAAVVVGWGMHGSLLGRDRAVLAQLTERSVSCLGVTKTGQPRHPLYAPTAAPRLPYIPFLKEQVEQQRRCSHVVEEGVIR